MGDGRRFEVNVPHLARIEGEGGVRVSIRDGKIESVEVSIFESPRFFEAILVGRSYLEAPDITARICGICPMAYVVAACRAMEKLLGVEPPEGAKVARRIAFYGEWIESHILHVAFLHAPDFLGKDSLLDLADSHPQFVRDALALRSWGNGIIEVVGGRAVHPVGFRVGGLHRVVSKEKLNGIAKTAKKAREKAKRILEFVAGLSIPDYKHDLTVMSLRGDGEYPIDSGTPTSNTGLRLSEDEFEDRVVVEQKRYSNSLHYRLSDGRAYVTGPLARFNLNFDLLDPEVRDLLRELGYEAPLRNTFQSIVARAAEVYHAVLEVERLIEAYQEPQEPYAGGEVRAGAASAIVEAPRGMLYHSYRVDEEGRISSANIIPPTAQNYAAMEEDIFRLEESIIGSDPEEAKSIIERVIRNYDPCVSCSVHTIRSSLIVK